MLLGSLFVLLGVRRENVMNLVMTKFGIADTFKVKMQFFPNEYRLKLEIALDTSASLDPDVLILAKSLNSWWNH